MRDTDYDAFAALLDDVAALLPRAGQQPLNGTAKAMYFRALMAHDIAEVRGALDAHVRDPQRGRFFPSPADLIAQLDGAAENDGRPGPEEAWAIALGAASESATVVWTDEIAAAWTASKPVFAIGDEVGARMAFREAYTRILTDARKRKEPAHWRVSLGFDKDLRRAAIEEAVHAGRLEATELLALPSPDGDAIAGLLEGPTCTPAAERARQALRQLADEIRHRKECLTVDTSERDALNAKKAEVDAMARSIRRQIEGDAA